MKKVIIVTLTLVLVLFSVSPALAETVTDQTYGNLFEEYGDLEGKDLGEALPSIKKATDAGLLGNDSSGNFRPFDAAAGTTLIDVMVQVLNVDSEEELLGSVGDNNLPEGTLKRSDGLVFIAKALGLEPDYGDSPFSDSSNPYVTALYNAGLVEGFGDGTVGLDRPLTRAELAILIDRMLEQL